MKGCGKRIGKTFKFCGQEPSSKDGKVWYCEKCRKSENHAQTKRKKKEHRTTTHNGNSSDCQPVDRLGRDLLSEKSEVKQ